MSDVCDGCQSDQDTGWVAPQIIELINIFQMKKNNLSDSDEYGN